MIVIPEEATVTELSTGRVLSPGEGCLPGVWYHVSQLVDTEDPRFTIQAEGESQ